MHAHTHTHIHAHTTHPLQVAAGNDSVPQVHGRQDTHTCTHYTCTHTHTTHPLQVATGNDSVPQVHARQVFRVMVLRVDDVDQGAALRECRKSTRVVCVCVCVHVCGVMVLCVDKVN